MDVEYTVQNRYFIGMEKLQQVKLGIEEDDVYQVIGSKKFKTRHTYNQVLAKRLMKMNYIPVTKIVTFSGFKSIITEGDGYTDSDPMEELGVAFFFYQNRLIHITIDHEEKKDGKCRLLPDSTKEVLYVAKHRDSEEPLSYSGTNGGGDEKYYGFVNGYLGERFASSGKRYFVPLVALNKNRVDNFLERYCKVFTYWESPYYEAELQKSGYYKLKAKLDKDIENKTGYWEEKSKK